MPEENILVIKLGALGDFIYSLGPMQAIRRHHQEAKIFLLTREAFAQLGKRSQLFDEIWVDSEPKLWHLRKLFTFRKQLISKRFSRIYDLQTSDRTGFYYRLMGPSTRPDWSGIVPGCSHYHHYKRPTLIHTQDRQKQQLKISGIENVPDPDLSFMEDGLIEFVLPARFALLVPGSSPNMKIKRWPPTHYAKISNFLLEKGITPVLIGSKNDLDAIEPIAEKCPEAINLAEKTTIFQIVSLARKSLLCIGNDTGPMHLIALSKCPTVSVFCSSSFPEKAAPRGAHIELLVRDKLNYLPVDEVQTAITNLGEKYALFE